MSQEQDADKKTSAESFTDIFKAFGQAMSEIFNDPELKQKAKEFAESTADSAKAFGSRLKDEDVKDKFRDVSKAADKFFLGNAQLLKQLEVTQASLQDNTKLVMSDQSKLINVLGLGEALGGTQPKSKEI